VSRIGRKPVQIPKGVTVKSADGIVTVKGPKGELSATLHPNISVKVVGVTEGYSRKLEIVGVGYRAELKGKKLQLQIGYSHPILFSPPDGIKIEVPIQTNITISGIDKQLVGLVAAKIRSFREPEPYKGKGIKYEGEYIRRKAGKAAATAATK
jgi:large subunit ribosomal protein L6